MTRKKLLLAALAALLLVLTPVALFLNFYLPSQMVLTIEDTYERRVDNTPNDTTDNNWRDVYYISTVDEKGKVHVFRNEDTAWGFPWYFKFNSADVRATAATLKNNKQKAVVRYYGWRINMLSMFPNATSVRPDHGGMLIPWFNIAFFSLIFGVFAWIAVFFRRRGKRSTAPGAEALSA